MSNLAIYAAPVNYDNNNNNMNNFNYNKKEMNSTKGKKNKTVKNSINEHTEKIKAAMIRNAYVNNDDNDSTDLADFNEQPLDTISDQTNQYSKLPQTENSYQDKGPAEFWGLPKEMGLQNMENKYSQKDAPISNNLYNKLRNTTASEYQKQYIPYQGGLETSTTNMDSNYELLKKIDNKIYLLEEQQVEKTTYITEELILYVFLGVFIIFVLDSFVRVGKYTR